MKTQSLEEIRYEAPPKGFKLEPDGVYREVKKAEGKSEAFPFISWACRRPVFQAAVRRSMTCKTIVKPLTARPYPLDADKYETGHWPKRYPRSGPPERKTAGSFAGSTVVGKLWEQARLHEMSGKEGTATAIELCPGEVRHG